MALHSADPQDIWRWWSFVQRSRFLRPGACRGNQPCLNWRRRVFGLNIKPWHCLIQLVTVLRQRYKLVYLQQSTSAQRTHSRPITGVTQPPCCFYLVSAASEAEVGRIRMRRELVELPTLIGSGIFFFSFPVTFAYVALTAARQLVMKSSGGARRISHPHRMSPRWQNY